ncbi:LANO_0A05248g1_1 [Lachancea nothofagi CBS 11611]|uniref:LANO_0A05248g1_1 n=1 Tax=Lachancea nothofagi CBS 11611 TaxID=1266666 RepID=A0A1G4IQZ2_9SACH|nr:LANO_0A05248g1_1 [Lachancea nothofagi CBS 11611]
MSSFPLFTLNTGATLPSVGLGTWQSSDEDAYKAVLAALDCGYRHIDTAAIYRNEEPVGRAIRDSKVPRSELFVTTKLWCTQQREPEAALDASLKRLGLDYVDLYLMHWPVCLNVDNVKDDNYLVIPTKADGSRDVDIEGWNFVKTWEHMQKLPQTGKTKAIGVSNFSINNLKEILKPELGFTVPAANQIEIHPQLAQDELIDFCKSKGIVVEAYSPLGSSSSTLLSDPEIAEVADKYKVEPAQVLINWGVARGYCVLPKSTNPKRIESNFKSFNLSSEDTQRVSEITKKLGVKRYVDPNWKPFKAFV